MEFIDIIEEMASVQYRYRKCLLQTLAKDKPKHLIWSDEIEQYLSQRGLKLANTSVDNDWISSNKTIIDYAKQFMEQSKLLESYLLPIN